MIDTSALVAVLQDELERGALTSAILTAPRCQLSAATLVEAGIVMQGRHGDDGAGRLDVPLSQIRVEVVPLTAAHAALARRAFRRYGKGRTPAALNYGDCLSYALVAALDEPLLFVGADFEQTDVEAAPY